MWLAIFSILQENKPKVIFISNWTTNTCFRRHGFFPLLSSFQHQRQELVFDRQTLQHAIMCLDCQTERVSCTEGQRSRCLDLLGYSTWKDTKKPSEKRCLKWNEASSSQFLMSSETGPLGQLSVDISGVCRHFLWRSLLHQNIMLISCAFLISPWWNDVSPLYTNKLLLSVFKLCHSYIQNIFQLYLLTVYYPFCFHGVLSLFGISCFIF